MEMFLMLDVGAGFASFSYFLSFHLSHFLSLVFPMLFLLEREWGMGELS
jgi:hypothetical protein